MICGQTCASCRWWERKGPRLANASRDPSAATDTGTCQVHAPVVLQGSAEFPVSLFPVTHDSRHCGDWRPFGGGDPDDGETIVAFPISRSRKAA